QLTKPGGKLIYDGRGFGGFTINVPGGGGVRDVVWGPKPQILSFKPLGGPGLAAEITWQVEVGVPECASASYQFRPLEFVFRVTYHPHRGYTTRPLPGLRRVPMSRGPVEAPPLPVSVDFSRERTTPPLIPGFDRSFGPWTIDESKTRLDWSIIDDELGGP